MIKDIYPKKAQFKKSETIEIEVQLEKLAILSIFNVTVIVVHLNQEIFCETKKVDNETINFTFNLNSFEENMMGFGVEAILLSRGKEISKATTSFDVVEDWSYAPRYGFLADFDKVNINDEKDVYELSKYHINIVQFYDWMYRHHDLIPPQKDFIDAMGRSLSLDVVKQKIDFTHKYGMRAMAYGAVYAAEIEFYDKNKELAILQNDGKVLGYIDFIYMMDINRESKWHKHIIREFEKAIDFGFDGIHMDQYGFPKEAWTNSFDNSKVRHLRNDFPELIEDTRKSIEGNGKKVDLIFNAVNNWPIDTVANTPQDCVYIEVWSPNDTFEDLNRIILNAKRYAPQKQVVLAAYLKSFLNKEADAQREAENGALLTMATIFSSGGFHLLLGEKNGVLTEAYYPTYATIICEKFKSKIRSYYDFIVRYEELLYSLDIVDNTLFYTGGINGEYVFKGVEVSTKAVQNKVWTQVKEKTGVKIIQLVNFTEVNNMNWVEGKTNLPAIINNIEITAMIVEHVRGVFLASPDFGMCNSIELQYTTVNHGQGDAIKFIVPELKVWNMVYILVDEK